MIEIALAAAVAVQPVSQPPNQLAALDQVRATNEARGMDAAKQGMTRGGYGLSAVATPYGVYVMAVAPGSKAATAGLKSGDDVIEIDGKSTLSMTSDQFTSLLGTSSPTGFDLTIANGLPVHLPPIQAHLAASGAPSGTPAAGCLGSALEECLAHIKQVLRVDDGEIGRQLARSAQTDVNGKPLEGSRTVTTSAFFGESSVPNILTIERDAGGAVASVEISLRGDPQYAQTAQEYADTGLGDAFRAVLPASCTESAGDLATFKFFENVVKPTITAGEKSTTLDETHASTDRMSQSASLPYCGARIRFSHLGGYDTDNIDEDNEHGAYSFSTIDFSRAPQPSHPRH